MMHYLALRDGWAKIVAALADNWMGTVAREMLSGLRFVLNEEET